MRSARLLIVMFTLATAMWPATAAQAPEGANGALIERTTRYIAEYEQAFAAIVSEERQVQTVVGGDGRVKKTRELRTDFLLIKTGPAWAQVFRDVLEVDGKPIRDRAERLRKLFLDHPRTAVEQAGAIARESQRHNLGVNRQGNSPLVPLVFLHPTNRARSRLVVDGNTITFEEVQRPTLQSSRRAGRRFDMPARGALVVEPASGRVLSGEFIAIGQAPGYSTSLSVKYAEDPELKLMVPVSVHERYWFEHKPKADRIEVEASYSNFRRFQVTTGEAIKPPK